MIAGKTKAALNKADMKRKARMKLSSLYPADWVIGTLALVVIFAALYFLRVDSAALTPNEQMLQNVD